MPIPDEVVKNFSRVTPIERRHDQDFCLRVFVKREGHVCQCVTSLSPIFFF